MKSQNNPECFTLASLSILVRQEPSQVEHILLANIRLGCYFLMRTNSPAYFANAALTKKQISPLGLQIWN
jgi:hypothetical protein